MLLDLDTPDVFRTGHASCFFQHGQVYVALDVAFQTWVLVPLPGVAEVCAFIHDFDLIDSAKSCLNETNGK